MADRRRTRKRQAAREKARRPAEPEADEALIARLDFIAGVLTLPIDASEAQKLALAKRAGLTVGDVARIFGKTYGAAQKAMERSIKNQ